MLSERSRLERTGISFIVASEREEFVSYSSLYERACRGLGFLQAQGIRPGQELVLQVKDNELFVVTFWACVLGGIVAVPVASGKNEDQKQKLFNIWGMLKAPFWITSSGQLAEIRQYAVQQGLQEELAAIESRFVAESGIASYADKGSLYTAAADDIAFVQYSSGSTGRPKGVVLRHRQLLANLDAISLKSGYNEADSMISWMPLTHDMGLIGFHLNPLYSGVDQYLMTPELFIRRPLLWLDKASEHKVTVLCSPNFGYHYLLKNIRDGQQYEWDLSSVRIVYNGAEPVSARLCREFTDRLAVYGLWEYAVRPVYGLAEASLAVTMTSPGQPVKTTDPAVSGGMTLVTVGRAINYCEVRIEDEAGIILRDGQPGRVMIRGENVTEGYYNDPEATSRVVGADGWLDTGDIGFLIEGELTIAGRAKDILFVNGQNFYPHDIERVLEDLADIELNKAAVTGCTGSRSQREEVLVFVVHKGDLSVFTERVKEIRAVIGRRYGFEVEAVIPVKELPKTTSGKLQRYKLAEQYRQGVFDAVLTELSALNQDWQEAAVPAANVSQQIILDIWKQVLQKDALGIRHNFFEAGGGSIQAIAAGLRMQEALGIVLPGDLLHRCPTVEEAEAAIGSAHYQALQPLPVSETKTYYPAASAQRRLYYIWEADKQSTGYNMPVALEWYGQLDVAKLEDTIGRLIDNHDLLRARFRLEEFPVFRIMEDHSFSLDVAHCAEDGLDGVLRSFIEPLDLSEGPLFRLKLVRVGEERYVLFLDLHHIISDGWSVSAFLRELLQVYTGQESVRPLLQFKDYVGWEGDKTYDPALLDFWKQAMGGELPVLALPADFPRPALFQAVGGHLTFAFDSVSTQQLREAAAANGVTLHVLLLSLYTILLYKYSGQSEVVVGIPVAGREHPALLEMQGMFVNNLCIRTSVSGGESLAEYLRYCQAVVAAAMEHRELLFEDLAGMLGVKRDASRNVLFDTMFIFQDMGMPDSGRLKRHFFDTGIARFDLSMEVFDEKTHLDVVVEYASSLFQRDTIQRMADHFVNLAGTIAENLSTPVGALELLSPQEYQEQVVSFNQTGQAYPEDKTIDQLFREQVLLTPERTALFYEDRQMNYAGLEEEVNRLASGLRRRGIGQGDIVVIWMPLSMELVISILAVLRVGAAYVPLDEVIPEKRAQYIIEDSRSRLVITASVYAQLRQEGEGKRLEDITGPDDLAYVIYTSGTTGTPKGVCIGHRSLVNYIYWAAGEYMGRESGEMPQKERTMPLFTSVAFDLTVTSIFTPLITGGAIRIYRQAEEGTPLMRILEEGLVDVVKLTPGHLRLIAASDWRAGGDCRIKRFIVGGENLTTALACEVVQRFNGRLTIFNEYGPTEATVGCMIHRFDVADGGFSVPIGKPAANTRLVILDRYGKHCPVNVAGELYISGDGLAKGYLYRQELTDRHFILNRDGVKVYRTGDMVKRLPDGMITFVGRRDQQVKINGYRVEPVEVERQLMTCEGVSEAVVVLRGDKGGQSYLCAYYTGVEQVPEGVLKGMLADRLPYYMIPERLVWLKTFPLTGHGKVDLAALPEPLTEDRSEGEGNWVEGLCMRVWKEVLQLETVSRKDSFYQLGGDSIKAVQIVARLGQAGIRVSVKQILTYHTIEQIAVVAVTEADVFVRSGPLVGEKPLSAIDRWFFGQRFYHPDHYNQSVLLRLVRPLDRVLLEKAFTMLVRHHDGLRLNYDNEKDILFYNPVHLEILFTIPTLYSEAEMEAFKAGFNLGSSLLIRAAIVQGAYEGDCLLITAHHLVVDGVSWRILLEGLYHGFLALERGEEYQLPASTNPWTATGKGSIQVMDFLLPFDHNVSDWRVCHARVQTFKLEQEQTAFLLGPAQGVYRTNVSDLLNVSLLLALREWTGQREALVVQEGHGRDGDGSDVSLTVGWFTRMVPVLLHLPEGSIGDQLKSVKEQLRRAFKEDSEPEGMAPVRLNYLGDFGNVLENDLFAYIADARQDDVDKDNALTACIDLTIIVVHRKLRVDIQYNSLAHRAETIGLLGSRLIDNLVQILDHIRREDQLHLTPSDFDLAPLDQADLDEIFA